MMQSKAILAGAAIAVLACGAASAAPHHHHTGAAQHLGAFAPPAQPVRYSELDAYLKASPKARASGQFYDNMASTGTSEPASATAPQTPPAGANPTDGTAAPPNAPQGAVNPPQEPVNPPEQPQSGAPAGGAAPATP